MIAAGIGLVAGIALIVTHMLFAVAGIIGGFFIPFFSCALTCVKWMAMAVFLIGVGQFVASYTWSYRKQEAIRVSALSGLIAGVVSQIVSIVAGIVLSVAFGVVGGLIGYLIVANGDYPIGGALIGGAAGFGLVLFITLAQFTFWVLLSVIFCAIGGVMYSDSARVKQGSSLIRP